MSKGNVFESSVLEYLEAGLHTRRGITAEEYIARCRKAWDSCHPTSDCPFKLLIDPLRPVSDVLRSSKQDYIHWRAEDLLAADRDDQSDIHCVAVGEAKSDLSFGESPNISAAEPDEAETRAYVVALFDVLGFSALLRTKGLDQIHALYARLISEAVTKEAMRSFGMVRLNDTESCSTLFDLPVRHAHFSDTIILWVPLVQHFISPFLARCADLVSEALKIGLPLRGAISAGAAVLHQKTATYLGEPIIEAARLEHAQNWIGASLGLSMLATDISREFDPNLIIPYEVPTKPRTSHLLSGLVLDWPQRFSRLKTDSAQEALRSLNTSAEYGYYYENAVKFAKFSDRPLLRREGMRGGSLSGLAAAAVEARAKRSEMDAEHVSLLRDIKRAGATGSAVAEFVERVVRGETPPPLPEDLRSELKSQMRGLELAASGSAKYFNLHGAIVDALYARFNRVELEADTSNTLKDLEQFDPKAAPATAFIRELAAGGHPVLLKASGLPTGLATFLRNALAWADGKVPDGVVDELANACLQARSNGGSLNEYHKKLLSVLGATGSSWIKVSGFLQTLATGGEVPPVPVEIASETARFLQRVRCAATEAGVQRVRLLEIMSIGLYESNLGVDLFHMVNELSRARKASLDLSPAIDAAIRAFEGTTGQHQIVGQHMRAVASGMSLPEIPTDLSAIVGMFLLQLRSAINGSPLPLSPQLVGWGVIRFRHEGCKLGDFTRFSLQSLLSGNNDMKTFGQYCCRLAEGGSAGPIPELTNPELVTAAKEMRCLADPQVGGFRVLLSPAIQTEAEPLEPTA